MGFKGIILGAKDLSSRDRALFLWVYLWVRGIIFQRGGCSFVSIVNLRGYLFQICG